MSLIELGWQSSTKRFYSNLAINELWKWYKSKYSFSSFWLPFGYDIEIWKIILFYIQNMVSLNHKHQLLVNKIKNISPNISPIVETSLRNSFFASIFWPLLCRNTSKKHFVLSTDLLSLDMSKPKISIIQRTWKILTFSTFIKWKSIEGEGGVSFGFWCSHKVPNDALHVFPNLFPNSSTHYLIFIAQISIFINYIQVTKECGFCHTKSCRPWHMCGG